jgi:hypothetical protein
MLRVGATEKEEEEDTDTTIGVQFPADLTFLRRPNDRKQVVDGDDHIKCDAIICTLKYQYISYQGRQHGRNTQQKTST